MTRVDVLGDDVEDRPPRAVERAKRSRQHRPESGIGRFLPEAGSFLSALPVSGEFETVQRRQRRAREPIDAEDQRACARRHTLAGWGEREHYDAAEAEVADRAAGEDVPPSPPRGLLAQRWAPRLDGADGGFATAAQIGPSFGTRPGMLGFGTAIPPPGDLPSGLARDAARRGQGLLASSSGDRWSGGGLLSTSAPHEPPLAGLSQSASHAAVFSGQSFRPPAATSSPLLGVASAGALPSPSSPRGLLSGRAAAARAHEHESASAELQEYWDRRLLG